MIAVIKIQFNKILIAPFDIYIILLCFEREPNA